MPQIFMYAYQWKILNHSNKMAADLYKRAQTFGFEKQGLNKFLNLSGLPFSYL